jgi:hypothetical protein
MFRNRKVKSFKKPGSPEDSQVDWISANAVEKRSRPLFGARLKVVFRSRYERLFTAKCLNAIPFKNPVGCSNHVPNHFLAATPKFVLIFFVSLSSSLSSPSATFLFFLVPAPYLFAEVALVGVAWLDPESPFVISRGVFGIAAMGVDCAVSVGDSCYPKSALLLLH